MKTCKFLSCVLFCTLVNSLLAQEGVDLGEDVLPLQTDSTAALQNYGLLGDFDGGYHVGDIAADFTVYDLDGNALNLYDKLAGDKQVIVCSGSATCVRYTNCFLTTIVAGASQAAREYMIANSQTFEWVFVYNLEAHPADLENCSSNCPEVAIPAPNGEFIYQHTTYGARTDAAQMWTDITNDPFYDYEFPHDLYIDNPNNGVYNTFFERPYGIVVLDCEGQVLARGDWTAVWLAEEGGIQFLDNLAGQTFNTCTLDAPECTSESLDTDEDGICDELENYNGTNPNDPCSPNNTDSDGDGICDIEEIIMGWDEYDACIPEESESCELCDDNSVDSDEDGICDEQEMSDGSDPYDPCSPNDFDFDQDGICDTQETLDGTDPNDPCDPDDTDTDGDGYCDLEEELNGWDPFDVNDPDQQLGLHESEALVFDLYPNPAKDILHVKTTASVISWTLSDMSGRKMKEGKPTGSLFSIVLSDLDSGAYILSISTGKDRVSRRVLRH